MKQKIKANVIISDSTDFYLRTEVALIDRDFDKNFKPKHFPGRLYYAGEILNRRQLKELDLLDQSLIRLGILPR